MRTVASGDPSPGGVSGSNANVNQGLNNAGAAGASAGATVSNTVAGIGLAGSLVGGRGFNSGSNLGAQNREPMGLCPDSEGLRAARAERARALGLTTVPPCDSAGGGSGMGGGPGNAENCMTECCLNPAVGSGPINAPRPGQPCPFCP